MAHRALREIYADWLRDQLDRPGWTVSRLAREAGVSRETIYRAIKGGGGLAGTHTYYRGGATLTGAWTGTKAGG